MADHFGAVTRIEEAVMAGDLARVRAEAAYLAQHPEPVGVDGWSARIAEMRVVAREIEAAPDPVTAAGLSAALSLACAHCHVERSAIVSFAWSPLVADDGTVAVRMQRHRWAVARLREGLIGSAMAPWLQGAAVLASPELEALLAVRFEARADARDLLDRIRSLAQQAPGADTPEARAALYGDMLATCAACHQRIRDPGGQPPP
jgi:cytochrome c553